MDFRLAELEDLSRIVEIYNSTVASRQVTADLNPVTVESKIAWFKKHSSRYPLWVFLERNEVIAWAGLLPFHEREAYSATAEVSIYLDEKCRGKGMGRAILKFVLSQVSSLEIETVLGLIFEHNEPSIRLFVSEGFEVWGFYPEVAKLDGVKRGLKVLGKKV